MRSYGTIALTLQKLESQASTLPLPMPARKPPTKPKAKATPRHSATAVVSNIARERELSPAYVLDLFKTCLGEIVNAAYQNGSCWIPGIGRFEVKAVAQKIGRHPVSGEAIVIPATTKLAFKQSVPRARRKACDPDEATPAPRKRSKTA